MNDRTEKRAGHSGGTDMVKRKEGTTDIKKARFFPLGRSDRNPSGTTSHERGLRPIMGHSHCVKISRALRARPTYGAWRQLPGFGRVRCGRLWRCRPPVRLGRDLPGRPVAAGRVSVERCRGRCVAHMDLPRPVCRCIDTGSLFGARFDPVVSRRRVISY